MAYVDSSGKTHVSFEEASHGYAATHTASRNAAGNIVGDSSGSRYVRQQEATKAAEQQQQQQNFLMPTYTPMVAEYNQVIPNTAAALQQKAEIGKTVVGASFIPTSLPDKATSFLSRTWEAMKQGYNAGSGNNYSLQGLVAPENKNTLTNSLYESTASLGEKYGNLQTSLLSHVPSGAVYDVAKGITNIPKYGIEAVGGVPYGLEAIGRNPTKITDSVALGLGVQVGSIVTKGKTHPLELGGEIVGAALIGKAAGASYAKVTPKQVRTITETATERQFSVLEGLEKTQIDTLAPTREYFKVKTRVAGENELNPSDVATAKDLLNLDQRTFNVKYKTTLSKTNSDLNTEITAAEGKGTVTLRRPNILQAEQKTLFGDTIVKVDKGKWEADLSGIQSNKFNFKKQYSVESYEGRENFEYDFATTVQNSRIRIINEVLPGKAAKESYLPANAKDYFDVPKTPKQSSLFDNFGAAENQLPSVKYISSNLLPGEKPGYFAFDRIALTKNNFKNTVRRLTEDESGELLPIHELKEIGGRPKSELDVWKRDILLEELEPKRTVTTRSFSVPNTYSKYWGIDAAGLGIISSSYFTKLGEPIIETTKNGIWDINVPKLEVNTAEKSRIDIISGNRLDIQQGIIPGIRQDIIPEIRIDVIPEIRPDVIPEIRPDVIPEIRPDVIPDIIPDQIPDYIPDIIPDQIPDNIPDQIPDYIPDIEPTYIFTENKTIFPFGAGDFDYKPGKESYSPRRKTKNKKLKNIYGDPFKVGIKIKL